MWADRARTNNETFANYGGRGFSMPPLNGPPNSLAAHLTYWHDMFNSVVVRVKYTVSQPAGILCDVPTAML